MELRLTAEVRNVTLRLSPLHGVRAIAQAAIVGYHIIPTLFRPLWGEAHQCVSIFFWLSGFFCQRSVSALHVASNNGGRLGCKTLLANYLQFLYDRCVIIITYLYILKLVYFERLPGSDSFGAAEYRGGSLLTHKWTLTWWTPLHQMRNYSYNESTWFISAIILHWIFIAYPTTLLLTKLTSQTITGLLFVTLILIPSLPNTVPPATPWQCFYTSPYTYIPPFLLGMLTSSWLDCRAGQFFLSSVSRSRKPIYSVLIDVLCVCYIWWGIYVSQTTYHPPQGYPDHVYRLLTPFTIITLLLISDLGRKSLTYHLLASRFLKTVATRRILLSIYLIHVPLWLFSHLTIRDEKPVFLLAVSYALAVISETMILKPLTGLSKWVLYTIKKH